MKFWDKDLYYHGCLKWHRFVESATRIGAKEAQVEAPCAISKLLFYGCEVLCMFHHNNSFQSFADCCVVHQVFQFIVSTYRWTGPLDRRLLFPKEAWLVSSSNSSSKFSYQHNRRNLMFNHRNWTAWRFQVYSTTITERNAYDIALKSKWAVFWTSTNFEFWVHACKDWCGELGTTWLIHIAGGRCMWKLAFKSLYCQMRIWGKKCWFQIKKGREDNLRNVCQNFCGCELWMSIPWVCKEMMIEKKVQRMLLLAWLIA